MTPAGELRDDGYCASAPGRAFVPLAAPALLPGSFSPIRAAFPGLRS